MKRCFKCREEKPLSEFYRHASMADGHLNKCKGCTRSDVLKHRADNIERIRAYDRDRAKQPKRLEKNRVAGEKWRAENPNRRSAQVKLGNAVRDGRVTPWPTCALPECNSKPEAHHPDYDRPLQVEWLCPVHHKQAHALFRRLTGSSQ